MKIPTETEEQRHVAALPEPIVMDLERLAGCGFCSEESAALLWLRQWYQMGGSDHMVQVHHWEFLKQLVRNGRLDV